MGLISVKFYRNLQISILKLLQKLIGLMMASY